MADLSPEQRIARYLDAYEAANGHRATTVRHSRGWYYVGTSMVGKRATHIDVMTDILRRRADG